MHPDDVVTVVLAVGLVTVVHTVAAANVLLVHAIRGATVPDPATDPATDPAHNLAHNPQDPNVPPGPRIRLRLLLALLRIVAGPRGQSCVTWSGQGFVYQLEVRRRGPLPFALDDDPTAVDGPAVRAAVMDALLLP